LIVAGLPVDPAVDLAQGDPDTHRVPRMVLVVRGARCIPRAPRLVALLAPGDGPPLAPRGLVLVPAPALARLVPAQVAQAV
jgi:hypothetical protein